MQNEPGVRPQRFPVKLLSDEERNRVTWLHGQNPNQPDFVVKRIGKIDLKQMHIARLQPLEWLNDELINAYFEVLTNNLLAPPHSAFAFNSFFLDTLQRKGYDGVARWTKSVDIFAYDYIFIPVHVESCDEGDHWCLVSINIAWRRIDYFDSLYSRSHCIDLDLIRSYLCREYTSRKGLKMKPGEWKINETGATGPQQENYSDCGVFVCQIARALLHKQPMRSIKACDMPYYRDRMLLDLIDYL